MNAPEKIRSFVERIERTDENIKDLNEDKRDIYAEAKGQGFDVPALKAVIARRRKDPGKLTEFEALVDAYEAALGTPVATRVHAREPETVVHSYSPAVKGDSRNNDDLAIPDFLRRQKVSA